MALAIAKLPEDASPDRELWIPVDEAAPLMEMTERHLRRLCSERFAPAGLARQVDRTWHISPRADERLPRRTDPLADDREALARMAREGAPARHLDDAVAKREILHGFERFDSRGMSAHSARNAYIAELERSGRLEELGIRRLSLRSLYDWERAYKERGIAGLVRKAGDVASPVGDAAIRWAMNWVNAGNPVSAAQVIGMTRSEAAKHPDDPAWRMPSDRTMLQEIARRRPKALKVFTDKGELACIKSHMPKRRRDYEQIPAMSEWVGDERTMDVLIRYLDARGWRITRKVTLTLWLDMRSRVPVGWDISVRANSKTILAALKRGIAKYGKPQVAREDWGKDYAKALGNSRKKRRSDDEPGAPRLTWVMEQLGIDVQPTFAPYMPWAKPVESFFATMKRHFDAFFATFMGGSPAERHEDLMDWCKANLEKLPTIHDLIEAFPLWVDNYLATPHGAKDLYGKTPLEAIEAFRDGPPRMETPQVLDHLFACFSEERIVGRDGIRLFNTLYGWAEPSLIPLQGKKVILRFQPDDHGTAVVCDLDRMPLPNIPVLRVEHFAGYTEEDIKRQQRAQREFLTPARQAKRAADNYFGSLSTRDRLELQRQGIEAVHGKRVSRTTDRGDAQVKLRPALEEALDRVPSPVEQEAKRLRSGTDDAALDIMEIIEPDASPDERGADSNMTYEDFLE